MVPIKNGMLFSQKRMNLIIFNNMDGARVCNAKQNKSVRERQIPYGFTHMWNLRNNKKIEQTTKKRQTKKQTLNYREHAAGRQKEVSGG